MRGFVGRVWREGGQLCHLGNDGDEGGKGHRHRTRATEVGRQKTDSRCTMMEDVTGLNWMVVDKERKRSKVTLKISACDIINKNGKSGGRSRF